MNKTSLINWILFILVVFTAYFSVSYFIKLTNQQSDELTALAAKVILSQSTHGKNAAKFTPVVIRGAVFKTNQGEIEIEFRADKAPLAVENFKKLSQSGFYDGTKFHRVIKGFMIQGGDPLSKDDSMQNMWGTGGPGYSFKDEFYPDDSMVQGVIAMANSGPNTNGSQFFIVTAANGAPWLVGRHTIFGKVVRGMDVALKIEKVATGAADRPINPVVLEKVILK